MPSALLIIDMQVGLFHGPDTPHDGERILANIQQLIHRARARKVPIYAVRHTGPQDSLIEAGSAFWQLLPALALNASTDFLFDKRKPNAFYGTALAEQLRADGVNELFIVGMKTQYCIDSTCRAAADLGFNPVLVADAHTCMDTPALLAPSIIEHHNATLNGAFARVVNTTDATF